MPLLNYFRPTFVPTCEAGDEFDLGYLSVAKSSNHEQGTPYSDFGEVPFLPDFVYRLDWQTRGLRLGFSEVRTYSFIHLKCMKYALENRGKVCRFRVVRYRGLKSREVLHPNRLFSG